MTDFRRPDLDLWDEEEDAEDQRPTIVSERPAAPVSGSGAVPRALAQERVSSGLPALSRMSLVQRLIAKGELEDTGEGGAAAAVRSRVPAVARGAGRPLASELSPIERAARAAADRSAETADNTEVLRDSEVDLLRLSEPGSGLSVPQPAAPVDPRASTPLRFASDLPAGTRPNFIPDPPGEIRDSREPTQPLPKVTRAGVLEAASEPREPTQPLPKVPRPSPAAFEARGAARTQETDPAAQPRATREVTQPLPVVAPLARQVSPAEAHGSGRELDYEDGSAPDDTEPLELVPTRLARRPRPQTSVTLRLTPSLRDSPVFRDREVTERISIPPLASSIAPAARSLRPDQRAAQRGMGGWQLALVAVLLIGAGLGVARLRREAAVAVAASAPVAASAAQAEATLAEPALPAAEDAPGPALAAPVAPTADRVALPAEVSPPAAPASVVAVHTADVRGPGAEPESVVRPVRKPRATLEPAAAQAASSEREPQAASSEAAQPSQPARASSPAPAKSAAAGLPAQPAREEVRAALNAVIPELQKCVGDRHGEAEVMLTVRSSGVVSYAVVSGSFAGSSEGSCIARTVKLAKFPPFSEASVRVSYPFQL